MIKINYYEAYLTASVLAQAGREVKSCYEIRFKLVHCALESSVSKAAKEFGTPRKTVRKWLTRYQNEGTSGLINHSRRPHHSPFKIDIEEEQRILAIRRRHPYLGPIRIKSASRRINPSMLFVAVRRPFIGSSRAMV